MEECSVLIETTKSAEDKTSRWFDLPIAYELFRDLLGVEADTKIKKLMAKWCQSRKNDNYKEEKVLQTPENQGLQKNFKN